MLKNIFVSIVFLLFTVCCAHSQSAKFVLVEKYENVCVFDLGRESYRRAYFRHDCGEVKFTDTPRLSIADDVDLSANEISVALKYIKKHFADSCRNSEKETILCDHNAFPDHVSRQGRCYVFWFGGAGHGFPFGLMRRGNDFASPGSDLCDRAVQK